MGTVKRADLARVLSGQLGHTKPLARQAVDAAFEGLIDAIGQGTGPRSEASGPGTLDI